MGGKNKTRLVGWHPKSEDDLAWLDAEIERRGGGRGVQSDILDEALALLVTQDGSNYAPAQETVTTPRRPARKPRSDAAPRVTFREPKACAHRVPPGAWCKTCQATKPLKEK